MALALAGALTLPGCAAAQKLSSPPPPAASVPAAAASTAASTRPATARSARSVPASQRNDLATGRLQRTFRSGALTVNVAYSSTLAMDRWTPDGTKPLTLSVTAFVNGKRDQKIYLPRVRADVAVSDRTGPLDAPAALDDTANFAPGYIVTFPNTYVQVFTLPGVDSGATSLRVDLSYEFLVQVSPTVKDFAKQTATDSLTIALH